MFSKSDKKTLIFFIKSVGKAFIIFPDKSDDNSKTLSLIRFSIFFKSNSSILEMLLVTFFNSAIAASEPSLISSKASFLPLS